MGRVKELTTEERDERNAARWKIIQAANNFKRENARSVYVGPGRLYTPIMYGMNTIQRAVFICRQRKLVKSELLKKAGFN